MFLKLKENGYDGIVVEIDNKLKFPSHPDFAAKDALDAETWKEICCLQRSGLNNLPLDSDSGHMNMFLKEAANMPIRQESLYALPLKPGTIELAKSGA